MPLDFARYANVTESIDRGAKVTIYWNAPVEIYTLDGSRVAEMAKGGFCIVRRGNAVVKIVK